MTENFHLSDEPHLPDSWNRKLFPGFAVIALGCSNASLCGEEIINPDNLSEVLNMELLKDPTSVRRMRLGLEFHLRAYLDKELPEVKGEIDFLLAAGATIAEGYKIRDEARRNGHLKAARHHDYQIQRLNAVVEDFISDPTAGIIALN